MGICLSTTQLLVLLVACPPGPDPLTNCSSSSSSFRTGRSVRSFLPALNTFVSPVGSGLRNGEMPGDPLHMTRLDSLCIDPMSGKSRDISFKKRHTKRSLGGAVNIKLLTAFYHTVCHQTEIPIQCITAFCFSLRVTVV